MAEEAQIFFGAIAGRTHDFYRRYRKAESYRRLTKDAVLDVYDASLAPNAPGRRKLSVRVASRKYRQEAAAVEAAATTAAETGGIVGAKGAVSRDVPRDNEAAAVLHNLDEIRTFKAGVPVYR